MSIIYFIRGFQWFWNFSFLKFIKSHQDLYFRYSTLENAFVAYYITNGCYLKKQYRDRGKENIVFLIFLSKFNVSTHLSSQD